MTLLSVNIDHIATIREARRTNEPDPVVAAAICELAGAHGITVHLRGDRRHIQHRDVKILAGNRENEAEYRDGRDGRNDWESLWMSYLTR